MIEILGYKPFQKGLLEGFASVKMPKWGNLHIREIACFKKNNKRWASFPSKVYEKDGEKKYFSYLMFDDPKMMDYFQKELFEALDKFLRDNPTVSEPQPVANKKPDDVRDDQLVPF